MIILSSIIYKLFNKNKHNYEQYHELDFPYDENRRPYLWEVGPPCLPEKERKISISNTLYDFFKRYLIFGYITH